MAFELLVLNKDWILGPNPDGKRHEGLTRIINKSYSKAAFKYGIIKSTRVKKVSTFLGDFQLTPDKEMVIFLLLGPQRTFDSLREDKGYARDFDSPTRKLEDCFSCNIPEEYTPMFQIDGHTEIDVIIAKPDLKIDEDITSRVLGTIGLKSYDEGTAESRSSKPYELTCFTSFMRKLGPKLLDIIIDKFLLNKSSAIIDHKGIDRFKIYADVIRDHNLVEYYTQNCGFVKNEDKEDFVVKVSPEGISSHHPFESDIIATRDFYISHLYRIIEVPKSTLS